MSDDLAADHVAYVFVSGDGESVQALGPPEAVDAVRAVIAERDRLREAIRVHRESVKCCDECAVAQTEDRLFNEGFDR